MRIAGVERPNIRETARVVLQRRDGDITLTVHALPHDYNERTEAELPSPLPPFRGYSKRKGRLEFDRAGKPVPIYDEQDEHYRKEVAEIDRLQQIRMIVCGLDPDEVQFETTRDGKSAREYYAALADEMHAYGFTLGDRIELLKAIGEVSGIDMGDILEARADFFETEGSPSDSLNTPSAPAGAGPTTVNGDD